MPSPRQNGKPHPRPHKDFKTFEFKIYTFTSVYSGDLELLTTTTITAKDISASGHQISSCKASCEEYVRNVALFGITVEDPEGIFNYYPPNRIAKIEYQEVVD